MKGYLAPHRVTPATLSLPPDEPSSSTCSSPRTPEPNCTHSPKPCRIDEPAFFDLVVIGAGPAGLALVARILEARPAALYTDQEHLYLHWLRRNRNPALLKTRKKGLGSDRIVVESSTGGGKEGCCCDGRMRILVIDKLGGGWMTNWDRQFAAFDIRRKWNLDFTIDIVLTSWVDLRSPLFFHPAPADLDSLIAFAERENRHTSGPPSLLYPTPGAPSSKHPTQPQPELIEIPGCVGAEISKHKRASRRSRQESNYARLVQTSGPAVNERDRRDYFTPGTSLFHDFCQRDVVERYGLTWKQPSDSDSGPITTLQGEVASLDWTPLHVKGTGHTEGFCVRTSNGETFGAKVVVSAVGMGGCPSIPPALLSSIRETGSASTSSPALTSGPGWAHSSCLPNPAFTFPPKDCNTNTLVVIGGGLTSAQIADLGLRKGFTNVVLLMRGHLKVKPFDVSLDWMGRYSNLKKMEFWQEEDPLARLYMLRSARNGGSITPTYVKILKAHQDRGVLDIRTNSNLEHAKWDEVSRTWDLALRAGEELETISADYIVAATGTVPSFLSLPFIKTLTQSPNVPTCQTVGGLPMLTSHLQWPGLPLFCVGGYSALQVGPGAFNLGGMREAADRVMERLEELALGRDEEEVTGEYTEGRAEAGGELKGGYTYFDFNVLSVEG